MTIIAKHGDLQVHEYSSGYEIEHIPTGLTHWMSDGVDMFTVVLPSGREVSVSPGTEHFNWRMQHFLETDREIMEAYFPQLCQPTTHYIAMGGMHGCLPNFCDVFQYRGDAVEYACMIHDLGPHSKFRRELKKFGTVELNLHKHGNEYAEVTECHCLEPWIHSDSGEKLDWWG